jgi:hypothetical protein
MRGNCIGGGMERSGSFAILVGGRDWASASLSQPEETPPIATGFDFAQPLLVGGTIGAHHLAPKTIVWPKPTKQVAEPVERHRPRPNPDPQLAEPVEAQTYAINEQQ